MKLSKVGKRIKYYREERKLTQEQLADKIGVTWEMVSRYERGLNEPYARIESIANALNKNISELLQEDNNASFNQIPLFVKIPKDYEFNKKNTTFFYTCPLWIFNMDREIFALDGNLLKEDNGIYYISPNTQAGKDSLVFVLERGILRIKKFEKDTDVIGVVLSKEVKYI